MAALVCDLCGGKLVMNTGGIAICDTCGMEYSAQRMREKIQELKGVVQADNSQLVKNYMQMAQNAYNSSNQAEAESYCNKILELLPNHSEAWLLKGRAAGWQSTLTDIRFSEAINCFGNAITNAAEEDRNAIIEDCKKELSSLAAALIQLQGDRFAKWPDEEEKVGITTKLTAVLQIIVQFYNVSETLIDKEELLRPLAITINNSVMTAWRNVVVPTFANDHDGYPDDYELNKLIERAGHCTDVLEQIIDLFGEAETDNITRCENIITIHNYLINANSYSYETVHVGYSWVDGSSMYENQYVKSKALTDFAKNYRRQQISKYQQKINSIKAAKKRAEKAAAQARHAAYWAAHPEEKKSLENQKENHKKQIDNINAELNEQVAALRKEKDAVPGKEEIAIIDNEIKQLTEEKNALGIFKQKEKKAIQAHIDQLESNKKVIRDKMFAATRAIDDKISAAKTAANNKIKFQRERIKSIDNTLTRDR